MCRAGHSASDHPIGRSSWGQPGTPAPVGIEPTTSSRALSTGSRSGSRVKMSGPKLAALHERPGQADVGQRPRQRKRTPAPLPGCRTPRGAGSPARTRNLSIPLNRFTRLARVVQITPRAALPPTDFGAPGESRSQVLGRHHDPCSCPQTFPHAQRSAWPTTTSILSPRRRPSRRLRALGACTGSWGFGEDPRREVGTQVRPAVSD